MFIVTIDFINLYKYEYVIKNFYITKKNECNSNL